VLYLVSLGADAIGYGITNSIKSRFAKHKKTFKNYGIKWEIIGLYVFVEGADAQSVEKILKKSDQNIDYGIDGFRTECFTLSMKKWLIESIEAHPSFFHPTLSNFAPNKNQQ
jgi:hypothetical protein